MTTTRKTTTNLKEVQPEKMMAATLE